MQLNWHTGPQPTVHVWVDTGFALTMPRGWRAMMIDHHNIGTILPMLVTTCNDACGCSHIHIINASLILIKKIKLIFYQTKMLHGEFCADTHTHTFVLNLL